jgi:hypothetical protein
MPTSEALEVLAEPCPCDLCWLRDRCIARELACSAYGRYIAKGRGWERLARTDASHARFVELLEEPPKRGAPAGNQHAAKRKPINLTRPGRKAALTLTSWLAG